VCGVRERTQGRIVIRPAASGCLGQYHAAVDIHGDRPFQLVAPGKTLLPIFGALDKDRADRPGRQPGRVDRHHRLASRLSEQPLDYSAQGLLRDRLIKPAEKAVQRGIVARLM
jgi:hypothetical protein